MNRRRFIKGLGALLATSAMVRPPAPEIEAVTNNVWPDSVPPFRINDAEFYVSYAHPRDIEDLRRPWGLADRLLSPMPKTFEGYVGEYLNFHIEENPQIEPGKLTWG